MVKFVGLALLGGVIALSGASGVCLAEEAGAKPETAAQAQTSEAQPQETPQAQAVADAPASAPQAAAEAPAAEKSAPAATKMRSLRKAAPAEAAPAPAPASKTEIASPDDTVGGLPGAKKAVVEKAP
jgi:hypothetical protein